MEAKKNLLTYAGLQKLEDELHDLKVNRRKEVAGKIKEAREQGDLSENAEYDAAKDEQRDIHSPKIVAALIYGLSELKRMEGKFAIITATFPPVLEFFMRKYIFSKDRRRKSFDRRRSL